MKRRIFIKYCAAGAMAIMTPIPIIKARAQTTSAELEKSFLSPPSSARPVAFWFWMNGNISAKGITLDLEKMKEIGVGEVLHACPFRGEPPWS